MPACVESPDSHVNGREAMSDVTVALIIVFGPMVFGTTFSTLCYLLSGDPEV